MTPARPRRGSQRLGGGFDTAATTAVLKESQESVGDHIFEDSLIKQSNTRYVDSLIKQSNTRYVVTEEEEERRRRELTQ